MYNAIKWKEELKNAGFSENQSEASVKVLVDVMNENFATKTDLKELKFELKSKMHDLKNEMRELRTDIKDVEVRMTKEMSSHTLQICGLIAAVTGLILAFHH
jgi:hypothetical protein